MTISIHQYYFSMHLTHHLAETKAKNQKPAAIIQHPRLTDAVGQAASSNKQSANDSATMITDTKNYQYSLFKSVK